MNLVGLENTAHFNYEINHRFFASSEHKITDSKDTILLEGKKDLGFNQPIIFKTSSNEIIEFNRTLKIFSRGKIEISSSSCGLIGSVKCEAPVLADNFIIRNAQGVPVANIHGKTLLATTEYEIFSMENVSIGFIKRHWKLPISSYSIELAGPTDDWRVSLLFIGACAYIAQLVEESK